MEKRRIVLPIIGTIHGMALSSSIKERALSLILPDQVTIVATSMDAMFFDSMTFTVLCALMLGTSFGVLACMKSIHVVGRFILSVLMPVVGMGISIAVIRLTFASAFQMVPTMEGLEPHLDIASLNLLFVPLGGLISTFLLGAILYKWEKKRSIIH